MRHVQVGKDYWMLGASRRLAVAHTKAKEGYLKTVGFAALSFQMARVIPPFRLELGMRIMIGREG
jgi:hypothetical protein